jgi:hypothetical protein
MEGSRICFILRCWAGVRHREHVVDGTGGRREMKLEERARLWVLVWSGTNFGGGRRQRFAAFANDRQGSGYAVGRSIVALAFLLEAQKTPCISSSAYTKDLDRQDTFF